MEARWIADRALLRSLAREHPTWSHRDLAEAVGRSLSWVKKWLKRFGEATPDDQEVLFSRSRAHHAPYPRPHPKLVERIVEMREHPPENLRRVPGPRALLYYLPRDPELQEQQIPLPRSTRTVWKILRAQGCIFSSSRPQRRPRAPAGQLEEIQLDFKDVTSVPADPDGKRQHVVEVLNFFDAGTSLWLGAEARADFHAETALEAVVSFLRTYGKPSRMTFDRDPRWIGSQSGRDFPSALRRFLLCLGIEPNVCPPRRPDKNPYVERLHRTLSEECLELHLPSTLSETRAILEPFRHHYNVERPHQGRACRNMPPRPAFPMLPALPPVPEQVDPDAWLHQIDGRAYVRKVGADGCVDVDSDPYYVKQVLAGQHVTIFVNASEQAFDVWHEGTFLKMIPIKRLIGKPMPFDAYVELMKQQARSEERQAREKQKRLRQPSQWA